LMVWRHDNDNPLLPVLADVVAGLTPRSRS